MSRPCVCLLALALLLPLPGETAAQRAAPDAGAVLAQAGWIETAWLTRHGIAVDAKLDTGADNSSLNAPDYETFERDGRKWVRFAIESRGGTARTIEAPLLRVVRIRRAGAATSERPVIALALCVAGRTGEAEVTLADRSGMDYAMLIGRSFLAGRLAVDSGRRHVGAGACEARAGKR